MKQAGNLKKMFFHFLTHIKISTITFSFFSYFKDQFLYPYFDQLEELSSVNFVAPRQKFTSYGASTSFFEKNKSIFQFFLPKSRFQTLHFHFFCTSETFFKSDFIILKNSPLRFFQSYSEKKCTCCGASTHFLKKKCFAIF